MKKPLLSRKFLVALGAILTMLAGVEMDPKTKGIIVGGIALAYLIIEGVIDYAGLPPKDPNAPPSSFATIMPSGITLGGSAELSKQLVQTLQDAIINVAPKSTPPVPGELQSRPTTPTSEPPKTLPGVGEERRDA